MYRLYAYVLTMAFNFKLIAIESLIENWSDTKCALLMIKAFSRKVIAFHSIKCEERKKNCSITLVAGLIYEIAYLLLTFSKYSLTPTDITPIGGRLSFTRF